MDTLQDVLDFFDATKPVKIRYVPTGFVNGRMRRDSSSDEDLDEDEFDRPVGLEYVMEYRKKERALFESNDVSLKTGSMSGISSVSGFDLESISSRQDKTTVDRIYSTYCFDDRKDRVVMPVDECREEIIGLMNFTQVIIVQGPTGCGKTTRIPQFVIDQCKKENMPCNVVVTQPRRIAAISIARRVCVERGWPLGTVCGFQVGLQRHVNDDTILTYCTTGVLLRKIAEAKHLNQYTHIIIDEVHERSEELDFLLLLVRRFIFTNSPKVKVILMSATLDMEKFSHYFHSPYAVPELPAPAVTVRKKSQYTNSYYYLDHLSRLTGPIPIFDVYKPQIDPEMYQLLGKLITIYDNLDGVDANNCKVVGNVLVFLPGIFEIEEAYKNLIAVQSEKKSTVMWAIYPLHSLIATAEQNEIFELPPKGTRKIILSTNMAESSITLPSVEYVIDFCLTKRMRVNPDTQNRMLTLEWASQVNCVQRSGRVGRVKDGRVYRLVPEQFYHECLVQESEPDVRYGSLDRLVLSAKLLDLNEPPMATLAVLMDPPDLEHINKSILNLKEAHALVSCIRGGDERFDGEITFLGKVMAALPLDIRMSKLICLGYMFGCLEECIIIAAGCSQSKLFTTPFLEKMQTYLNVLTFADGSGSDLIAYLNLYRVWERLYLNDPKRNVRKEKEWCRKNYISYRSIKEWGLLVLEIKERLKYLNIELPITRSCSTLNSSNLATVLKVVICGAFYPNYYTRRPEAGQINERDAVRQVNGLDPFRTVYFTKMDNQQPGPIYVQRIKELLKPCSNNVEILFDRSTKIYATFPDTRAEEVVYFNGQSMMTKMPGRIPVDVYKAVRMRQVRLPMEIPVLHLNEAWEYAKRVGVAASSRPGDYQCIKRADSLSFLPSIQEIAIDIFICHVVSAGHFFAQRDNEEVEDKLAEIDEVLNSTVLKPNTGVPVIGQFYATKYSSDSRYYRCQIININPFLNGEQTLLQVLFIDYGNTTSIDPGLLYKLPSGTAEDTPPLAIECTLSHIQPSVILNPRGLWTDAANEMFTKCTADSKLIAKIYSCVNGVVSCEIFKDGRDTSFNKFLITKGYAQIAEESFLSKENNLIRLESQRYFNVLNSSDSADLFVRVATNVKPPAAEDCKRKITLLGPNSPLEMKVYGVGQTSSARVKIDTNSVNAVLLDNAPEDPHERLLVAVVVGQGQNSSLQLRDTTLMPNIPGFPAIMAMLFCPQIELKPTKDGSSYGAVLCGLGKIAGTKRSLYPAHDIILTLDTLFDDEDFETINEMRFCMNKLANLMEDNAQKRQPVKSILDLQIKLQKRLLGLLTKQRNVKARDEVMKAHIWGKYLYEGDMQEPGNSFLEKEIWKLHSKMTLNDDIKKITVMKNLADMRVMARGDKEFINVICHLCDVPLKNEHELKVHLCTSGHITKEKLFK